MALVQSSLQEEILSRQERAVIRGIYRASQLNDALEMLNKITNPNDKSEAPKGKTALPIENVNELKQFLANSVRKALVNTKVPAMTSENSPQLEVKSST